MNIIDVNRRRDTHNSRDINNVGISREIDSNRDARDSICMDANNSKVFFQKFATIVLKFLSHSQLHSRSQHSLTLLLKKASVIEKLKTTASCHSGHYVHSRYVCISYNRQLSKAQTFRLFLVSSKVDSVILGARNSQSSRRTILSANSVAE